MDKNVYYKILRYKVLRDIRELEKKDKPSDIKEDVKTLDSIDSIPSLETTEQNKENKQIFEHVQQEWAKLDKELLRTLVRSMPNRIKVVIKIRWCDKVLM